MQFLTLPIQYCSFFTVALFASSCLLAFSGLFFRETNFNVVLSNTVLLYRNIFLLYVTLIVDSDQFLSLKEFLYQLVRLGTNW